MTSIREVWMKILVIDDHPLLREAVREVLKQLDASIEVIEASDCDAAFAAAEREPELDLILLDIQMPGRSGLDALADFREKHPEVPVVVLSGSELPGDVMRALDGGAMGFIPKSQPSRVMINALRLVLAGGVYLPPEILNQSIFSAGAPPRVAPAGNSTTSEDIGLTERQGEVLALLVQGKPNKLICRELGLAEGTVKIHISAILKALGVNTRTQAVIAVSQLGLKLGAIGPKPGTAASHAS